MTDESFTRETVDAIPVIHVIPTVKNDRQQLALFLPYLGGTRKPSLLSSHSWPNAVSPRSASIRGGSESAATAMAAQ